MLERFTTSARDAVTRARAEAVGLGHREIGSEHLLLAIIDEETGTSAAVLGEAGVDHERVLAQVRRLAATPSEPLGPEDADALRSIGVDLDAVRARIAETFGPGALDALPSTGRRGLLRRKVRDIGLPRFSARGKKVLECSLREAIRRHDRSITTAHLLLGLLDEGGGAVTVLTGLGVDVGELRGSVTSALDQAA
jgi:ATP-dependent Clp protease ATP-binding subunit ClpA